MKFKYAAVVGIVALLTVGCGNVESQSQDPETQPQAETVAESPADSSIQASGDFIDAEHPTKGTASIITENGKKKTEEHRLNSSHPSRSRMPSSA